MIEFISHYWLETMFTGVSGLVFYTFKQYMGLRFGMRALLKNEIIRICDTQTYYGHCPSYMKDNVREMYENYNRLGGNGMITTMVNHLYELPNEKKEV